MLGILLWAPTEKGQVLAQIDKQGDSLEDHDGILYISGSQIYLQKLGTLKVFAWMGWMGGAVALSPFSCCCRAGRGFVSLPGGSLRFSGGSGEPATPSAALPEV